MTRFRKEKASKFLDFAHSGDLVSVVLNDKYRVLSSSFYTLKLIEASTPRQEGEYHRSQSFIAHYHGFGTHVGKRDIRFDLPNSISDISILENEIKEIELYNEGETFSFRSEK